MNQDERRALLARLHALPKRERRSLMERAEQARKPSPRGKTERPTSLEELALRLLREAPEGREEATVLAVHKGRAVVRRGDEDVDLPLAPALLERQTEQVAPGDRVRLSERRIEAVEARRTELARIGPGGRQVIAANVDLVVHVVSVVAPPLHPRIVDRVRLATERGGAEYALAVNKLDLPGGPDELRKLDRYEGLTILPVSAETQAGLPALRRRLHGRLSAFVGHSGVGKSTLLNRLVGESVARTGAVSEGNRRGSHTTTGGRLWELGDGTRIIDTPGVRAFGLPEAAEEDEFPEFAGLACRFRDCTHRVEPGCGVLAAVAEGSVSAERYDAFVRLRGG